MTGGKDRGRSFLALNWNDMEANHNYGNFNAQERGHGMDALKRTP